MGKDISLVERRDALVARRESRNPGLAKVRIYKWGRKTALLSDNLIMPTKTEFLDMFEKNILDV